MPRCSCPGGFLVLASLLAQACADGTPAGVATEDAGSGRRLDTGAAADVAAGSASGDAAVGRDAPDPPDRAAAPAALDAPPEAAGVMACPAGRHRCGEACVDDGAVDTCGTSCVPCPKIRRGATSCDGTRCVLACPQGFRICRDRCMPDDHACSETCGWIRTLPVTCGQICVADTPDSCCSRPELCGAFGCRDNRCLTSCTSNADCSSPQTCDVATGQCGPCGGLGQPCCYDQQYQDYECTGDDLYCAGMKCAKVPAAP